MTHLVRQNTNTHSTYAEPGVFWSHRTQLAVSSDEFNDRYNNEHISRLTPFPLLYSWSLWVPVATDRKLPLYLAIFDVDFPGATTPSDREKGVK